MFSFLYFEISQGSEKLEINDMFKKNLNRFQHPKPGYNPSPFSLISLLLLKGLGFNFI